MVNILSVRVSICMPRLKVWLFGCRNHVNVTGSSLTTLTMHTSDIFCFFQDSSSDFEAFSSICKSGWNSFLSLIHLTFYSPCEEEEILQFLASYRFIKSLLNACDHSPRVVSKTDTPWKQRPGKHRPQKLRPINNLSKFLRSEVCVFEIWVF